MLQASFATCGKFSKPFKSFNDANQPLLNNLSDWSNGMHVIRSPALPPSNLALTLAAYWFGIVVWNITSISGCFALNAGIIFSFHASASSFLHDSSIKVPATALLRIKRNENIISVIEKIFFIFPPKKININFNI